MTSDGRRLNEVGCFNTYFAECVGALTYSISVETSTCGQVSAGPFTYRSSLLNIFSLCPISITYHGEWGT